MSKPYHPACHPDMCLPEEDFNPTEQYGGNNGPGGARASLTPYPEGPGGELGLITRSLLEQAKGLQDILTELKTLTKHVKGHYGI